MRGQPVCREILVDSGGLACRSSCPTGKLTAVLIIDQGVSVAAAVARVAACPVRVTGSMRRMLIRRARGQTTPYRDKVRAQIVLRAAERQTNGRSRPGWA